MSKVTHYPFNNESRPETKSDLVLYSYQFCPFVQKTRLALLEKKVDYEEVEVDLKYPRPQWYLDINPKGLVPSLIHKGKTLIESAICSEYVEEEFNHDIALLPKGNYLRAIARLYISEIGDFSTKFFQYLSADSETVDEKRKNFEKALRDFDSAIEKYRQDDGPYFFGSQFTLVDIHILPFLERIPVLEKYKGFKLSPDLKNLIRLRDAGFERESFKATKSDLDELIPKYEKFVPK